MSHIEGYQSFQTKKSIEKKQKAKSVSASKAVDESLFLPMQDLTTQHLAIVVETSYKYAKVIYNETLLTVDGLVNNIPCNRLVFPGDYVLLDKNSTKITHIAQRSTVLSRDHKDRARRSNAVSNKVIATNIDVAVIVVSAFSPPLHPKFIDRYLMILQNCNIQPVICLNKADLKTEKDDEILNIYRKLNIPVVETSTLNNNGINSLKSYLLGKRAIFVGHSGVGKSSLTNALMNTHQIKTGEVGEKSLRGRHTTTSSKFYFWSENSSIIDTPGIRALDVSAFDPSEIQYYFSEFAEHLNCRYRTCNHINTKTCECGVKIAVEKGFITTSRYDSYVRIMQDLLQTQKINQ